MYCLSSRCGRSVWSLGRTLNEDQWLYLFKTSLSFSFFSTYITINHQTYIAFHFYKNVFVCYFCPFLSMRLFLHKYNVMTGSKMYIGQTKQ